LIGGTNPDRLKVRMKEKNDMDDTNSLTELKAALIVGDFNRRERLLKIIRGKPEWGYRVLGLLWVIAIIYMLDVRKNNGSVSLALIFLGFGIVGVYLDLSRRMNALIKLIGEDNLRKPKTDGKEQSA
jgi:hypothetical protein